jgi:hypothetical protein
MVEDGAVMFTRSWTAALLGFVVVAGGLRAGDGVAADARDQPVSTFRLSDKEEFLYQLQTYRCVSVRNYELSFRETDGKKFYSVCLKHRSGRRGSDEAWAHTVDIRFVETAEGAVALLHMKNVEWTCEDGSKMYADDKTWELSLP